MNIYTLSRAEAENITDHFDSVGSDSAIISIGPPGEETADLDEDLFGAVLRLHFHDADPNTEQTKDLKLLDDDQVESAIGFVEMNDPDTLFVQCQAGQSRSCGTAYAFHEHYNDGGLKDGWENYNQFAHKKFKEALRGFRKDQEYYQNIFSNYE